MPLLLKEYTIQENIATNLFFVTIEIYQSIFQAFFYRTQLFCIRADTCTRRVPIFSHQAGKRMSKNADFPQVFLKNL